jgi:predicted metal-dependent hydrolase
MTDKNTSIPSQQRTTQTFRISNLIKFSEIISTNLSHLAQIQTPKNSDQYRDLFKTICRQKESVDSVLVHHSKDAGSLAAPSQQAYLFLLFLSSPQNFEAHIATLMQLFAIAQKSQNKLIKLSIEMKNMSSIYHFGKNSRGIHLVLHEAFIEAPGTILEDLVALVSSRRSLQRDKRIKEYIKQPLFQKYFQELKSSQKNRPDSPGGKHFDLEKIFEQVNREYFSGSIARPRLVWTRTATQRKLGHYQAETDTVAISRSLDSSRTPPTLINFIMYHELLHKQLGTKLINGRRYAHTPEFRKSEHLYKDYEPCQLMIKNLHFIKNKSDLGMRAK